MIPPRAIRVLRTSRYSAWPSGSDADELAELLLDFSLRCGDNIANRGSARGAGAYRSARSGTEVALFLLDPVPFDSERFKEVVTLLKEKLELRGRDLFHPLRLALAGRSGEGELDRVVLLLEEAAAFPFAVQVKPARARILEFCAAVD